MESAKYGRMELGRCVIRDYGYVGCSADVLAHMDSRCSGRRSCDIRIPDSTLDRANPCPRDFKTYLEASYGCVQGKNMAVMPTIIPSTKYINQVMDHWRFDIDEP